MSAIVRQCPFYRVATQVEVAIKEEQLRNWAGIAPGALREIGRTTLNNRPVLLSRADAGLHRNIRGHRDDLLAVPPMPLELPEGIVVHPRGDTQSPRLPLLGLRALVHNRLRAIIDGRKLRVSIKRGLF